MWALSYIVLLASWEVLGLRVRRTTLSYDRANKVWRLTLPKRLADRARLDEDQKYPVEWEEAGDRKFLLIIGDGRNGDA